MATPKKFLKHIHYFRAFAIINIVIVHLWHIPSAYQDHHGVELVNTVREVAFHDSTIYFLFISGFLFYYLSPRFELIKYYRNKLFNVISPYLIIASSIVLINQLPVVTGREESLLQFFKYLGRSLLNGSAQIQYWYIPFISLVFLISPFLLKIPATVFQRIVLLGCLSPLLGLRTDTSITVYQYLYFFPIYLLGIYSAMDYSNVVAFIKEYKNRLIFLLVITTGLLIFLHGKPYYLGFVNITESLYYIQKVSICFLATLFLMKLENKEIVLLDLFATYSFAIYFMHTLVGDNFIKIWYYHQVFAKLPGLIFPLSFFYVATMCFITLFVCMLLKRVLGKQSRYFIGA